MYVILYINTFECMRYIESEKERVREREREREREKASVFVCNFNL